MLQSIEAGHPCSHKRLSSFLKCLWAFFWWPRVNPHQCHNTRDIMVPNAWLEIGQSNCWRTEKSATLRTGRTSALSGRGVQDWQGRGNSPSQVQLLQHLLKGDEVEAKENSYRALGVMALPLDSGCSSHSIETEGMEVGDESFEERSSERRGL